MSKIKNGGLDQYGAGPFEQQQFGTAGVVGVNVCWQFLPPANVTCIVFGNVCVCVCLSVRALTFPFIDLQTSFSLLRYIFIISRSRLSVKFIGSRSQERRSNECNKIHAFAFAGGLRWIERGNLVVKQFDSEFDSVKCLQSRDVRMMMHHADDIIS